MLRGLLFGEASDRACYITTSKKIELRNYFKPECTLDMDNIMLHSKSYCILTEFKAKINQYGYKETSLENLLNVERFKSITVAANILCWPLLQPILTQTGQMRYAATKF